jgi:hypothetical protein
MAISDTSFFSSYQAIIGTSYAKGFEEVYSPTSTLITYIASRQLFLASMSTTEVANGVSVVNAHLSNENTYSTGALNIAKTVNQTLNNFFNNTYSSALRDWFNALSISRNVAWQNSFKESWYQANAQELVQQIGFASWNGTSLIYYPATSPITNKQNVASISTISGNNVTVSGFSPITNFAMNGDIIVASPVSGLPSSSAISLSTTVVGVLNTNTIILSGPISTTSSTLYAFRPIKNAEYFEFRFGTASITGLSCTNLFSNLGITVYLSTGVTTVVNLSTTNATGRANIGIFNNSTYRALGITSMGITSGSIAALGTVKALEVWVKSTN